MKKYVLTGGPGCGKSSILLYLELFCNEYIIREIAEDYIKVKQAMGIEHPWEEKDFQDMILEKQIARNKRVHPDAERVFWDRDVLDGLAYAKEGTDTYNSIRQAASDKNIEKVFLVELLDDVEQTTVRREDLEASRKIEQKLEEIYSNMGCEVMRIPAGKLEERVKRVMSNLQSAQKNKIKILYFALSELCLIASRLL